VSSDLLPAQQEPHRWLVIGVPQEIIDRREVQIQLTDKRRSKGDRLELNNDVATKSQMIEQKVECKILAAHLELDLPAHEGKARSQLQEKLLNVIHEGLLNLALPP